VLRIRSTADRGTKHVLFNSIHKSKKMKLSKSLLSAILIGIAVQTTTVSCGKEEQPKPEEKEVPKKETPSTWDSCPACGMG
jgi:hypothetical protein